MIFLVSSWLCLATAVSALSVSFKQARHPLQPRNGSTKLHSFAVQSNDTSLTLNTVRDLIYIANVTVGGIAYPVQLDTGSSDLWIKGPTTPLPNTNTTSTTYNLTYGIGWAQGTLSYATVQFAGITVPNQAFLDAATVQNPALSYGADGICGLGFTSLSTLDAVVNQTGSPAGRSLLYNLFNDNPSEPNFISFSLQRSTEPGDDVEGIFSIGEHDPQYAAIDNNSPIPTFPVNSPKRWTVLIDAVLTQGSIVTASSNIAGAPSNKAVVLLDSGTSWTYAPEDVCNAIYGNVPGASYSSSLGQWVVPCDAEIDIALQIGGQVLPVHPLDVSPTSLSDSSTCVGSFVPQSVAVGAGEFDWLIGDNFLRSVYSMYDFGDFDANHNMGNPYIKLLSIVDPNEASKEFVKVRGGTARTNITYNAANDTSSGSTTVSLSTDVAKTLDQIGKYFPAMLGVMALNALVLLALVVVAIVYMCRQRRKRARTARIRTPNGRLTPMPVSSRNSYIAGTPPADQYVYEPISMAITEDTMFVPPSPGFRQFDGKAGDRPRSVATLPSQSRLYQEIGSDDALVAPKASFAKADRPKSLGMNPDQPFTPPPILRQQSTDNVSLRSGKSGISLVDDDPVIQPLSSQQTTPEDMPFVPPPIDPLPPQALSAADRPRSVVVPLPVAVQAPEDILLPPSPGLSNGFSLNERPSSVAMPPPQVPMYPPPQGPHSASPRFAGGATLRPNAHNLVNVDRPMSVGGVPTQLMFPSRGAPSGDPRFTPPTPPFRRQGSSLRPGATVDRPMSAMLPSQSFPQLQQLQLQQVPGEEDITAFQPPVAPFRRSPSGTANDRPMSMA